MSLEPSQVKPIRKDWPKRNKFEPGRGFRSTTEAVDWIEQHNWCYWGSVPKHHSVVRNFSLSTIIGAVNSGTLRPAIKREP